MDIALELGRPLSELGRMSMHEMLQWQAYARRRLLPSRRVEFYLAQIALLIARTMGGATKATLADFLLAPPREELPADFDEDAHLEQMVDAFQFKPRK
jgi:hypothetical protein